MSQRPLLSFLLHFANGVDDDGWGAASDSHLGFTVVVQELSNGGERLSLKAVPRLVGAGGAAKVNGHKACYECMTLLPNQQLGG